MRALLGKGEVADSFYREWIDWVVRACAWSLPARICSTASGCVANRRLDAREQLRTAHEMLAAMGVEAFARAGEAGAVGHQRALPARIRRPATC